MDIRETATEPELDSAVWQTFVSLRRAHRATGVPSSIRDACNPVVHCGAVPLWQSVRNVRRLLLSRLSWVAIKWRLDDALD